MKHCIKLSAASTRIAGVDLGGRYRASSGTIGGRVVSRCGSRYSPEGVEGPAALQAQIGQAIGSTNERLTGVSKSAVAKVKKGGHNRLRPHRPVSTQ